MALPAQPCNCSPYSNICCCGTQTGITVVQPKCQTLPDGSVVNNPAFVLALNASFWTYKFSIDCNSATRGISAIGIPICLEINAINITVEEKIDGCGDFNTVPFELIQNDPNFGSAPTGFQFLKIETGGRYDKGLCVEYRIRIIGDYPEAVQPISVKAATVVYKFACTGCFIVPGCVPKGQLLVSKECGTIISNNQASFEYEVHVDNVGKGVLSLVEFEDVITIPSQLSIGSITVSPSSLNVDTSTTGQVKIFGNIGTIEPGGRVVITYSIPVVAISSPGGYLISNTARAAAEGTKSADLCGTTLNVVKLSADKCCSVNGSMGIFKMTISSVGNSPNVVIDIFDRMQIPFGVTVNFSSFNGCEAYFADTLTPIPLNTNIEGPVGIDIICRNATVPSNGSFEKTISYSLVSSSVTKASVVNTITNVSPKDIENLVYEGTENIPAAANIEVELLQTCRTPCM
ncbi:hypothetical protein [Caproiciproducens galactitolivorans]|uniref:hypothetical protein n=1 Tax=Caproiciproducens galactitolivorans TaxID=642589 RepID=UPI002409F742|nr:hypothetical protein [Caproiciproducens galactitolivorans]